MLLIINIQIITIFIIISSFTIGCILYFKNLLKNAHKIKNKIKDSLTFYIVSQNTYTVTHTHIYKQIQLAEKYVKVNIENAILHFKINNNNNHIIIESIYNDLYYPLYEFINEDHLTLFKEYFINKPYVIFKNGNSRYFCIIDESYENKYSILNDTVWLTLNNKNYTRHSVEYNLLTIIGLYYYNETENYKPIIIETNGEFSENFRNFINSLIKYYDNEGFELSVLKFKEPKMIFNFNRQKKLKKLSIINDTN